MLGFDYGYSLDEPNMLIMWEAQFGDFANGAQVIIDQFIASAESKWGRASGLVMLLPHGYEGQGPEHSSARLERFLQLCAEENIQVTVPSTPAQYFHLLRRQVRRGFRKPLVVMTPKSLLRHKQAVSPIDQLTVGHFHDVIDDPAAPERARRVLFCSGKVYYDLAARRAEVGGQRDVAIIRIEQLYPWPIDLCAAVAKRYRSAREWVWVQEESQNMGAWTFVAPRLEELLGVPRAIRRPRRKRQPRHRLEARSRPRAGRDRRSRRRPGRPSPGLRLADSAKRRCQRRARSELAMPSVPVTVPSVGESISEGILSRWHKADGSLVKAGEPLFELETDKATSDIPAAGSGVLRIAVTEGETVAVGATVATIDPADPAAATPAAQKAASNRQAQEPAPKLPRRAGSPGSSRARRRAQSKPPTKPAALAGRPPTGRAKKASTSRRSPPPARAAGSPRATSWLISSRPRQATPAPRPRSHAQRTAGKASAADGRVRTLPAKPASA